MRIAIQDYAQALYEAVAAAPDRRDSIIQSFLNRLALDKKSQYLPLILQQLEVIEAARNQQQIVSIVTAEPLEDAVLLQLKADLQRALATKEEIVIRTAVEPTVIGGIRIAIGDTVIDHTIRAKLNQLAAQL